MNAQRTDQLLNFVFEHAVRGDPDTVVDAIDRYGRAHGGMIHLGAEKGEIFDRIVSQSGALRVLELGTNYGYSALRLMRAVGREATVDTVEIDAGLARTAEAIFAFAGLGDRIRVHNGRAGDIIGGFDDPFDLVFIDHYPENYLADLRLLEQRGLVASGTTIMSDNVVIFERQLTSYLEHLRHGVDYDSTLHRAPSVADGIEVSVRRTPVALRAGMSMARAPAE